MLRQKRRNRKGIGYGRVTKRTLSSGLGSDCEWLVEYRRTERDKKDLKKKF